MLAGKIAVITGGSPGIGLATARLMLAYDAKVAITGQDPKRLQVASELLGAGVITVAADVLSQRDMQSVATKIGHEFGALDIVFANAGVAYATPLAVKCSAKDNPAAATSGSRAVQDKRHHSAIS